MPIHTPHLDETTLFTALKAQIINLATPLYGTYAADADKVFDVVAYTVTTDRGKVDDGNLASTNDHGNENENENEKESNTHTAAEKRRASYGVALILYTGPATSPFMSWEMISCVHDQASETEAAEVLLGELKGAMGSVVNVCLKTGNWSVQHDRIPDVDRDGGADEETDGPNANARGRWNPSLEAIGEEV